MFVDKTEQLLTALVDRLAEQSAKAGLSNDQLTTILEKVGVNSAEAMRASLKPENTEHAHISAYFTAADKAKYGDWTNKPKLSRKTFFNGAEEDSERLTCAEIEAYNAITETREARNGKWKAQVVNKGYPHETLSISLPCATVDQRMEMPPNLLLILHELNGGASTEDIGALIREVEDLKQQLKTARGFGTVPALASDLHA